MIDSPSTTKKQQTFVQQTKVSPSPPDHQHQEQLFSDDEQDNQIQHQQLEPVKPSTPQNSKNILPDHSSSPQQRLGQLEQQADEFQEEQQSQRHAQQVKDLQLKIMKHQKKLVDIERVLQTKKQEEQELINNANNLNSTGVNQLQTISSLGNTTTNQNGTSNDYSVEEWSNLLSECKKSMQKHANQLKFLINTQQKFEPFHEDRVCEAFFEADEMWYAALIQEVNQNDQSAKVAWIGFGQQEVLPKQKITLLNELDQTLLPVGAVCLAVYPQTGVWYEATVLQKLSEQESEQFAATDMRSNQTRYRVKFNQFEGHTQVVPLDFIRLTPNLIEQNAKRQQINLKKEADQTNASSNPNSAAAAAVQMEFQLPEHLRVKQGENEKVREQKRKKVKALKFQHKAAVQETIHKSRQNEWLNFNKKNQSSGIGGSKRGGPGGFGGPILQQDSIFRSGDGKVGISNAPGNNNVSSYNAGGVQEFKTGAYKRAKINYIN